MKNLINSPLFLIPFIFLFSSAVSYAVYSIYKSNSNYTELELSTHKMLHCDINNRCYIPNVKIMVEK